ncbi:MAG: NADH-quinone oxidoreductase subunit C [Planctomycetota bacterium]|jgi:NADH-quinone oxidoreductase subunit C
MATPPSPESSSSLDHPTLPLVKEAFTDLTLHAAEFRGQTTLIVPVAAVHRVARFLRDDPACDYNQLSTVTGADYLDYPAETPGRFAVIWLLSSHQHGRRLRMKTFLDPTIDTSGIEPDPALEVDSVCDIWPGAEWPEREVYDMFGIRFRNHPDLRRILTWKEFPAHPLRKDYPLRGRGERERYVVVDRESS